MGACRQTGGGLSCQGPSVRLVSEKLQTLVGHDKEGQTGAKMIREDWRGEVGPSKVHPTLRRSHISILLISGP